MRKLTALLAAAGMIAAMSGAAMAAGENSASATATTQAVVVKPITLIKATDLNFGRLASVAGTVSISESVGTRSSTDNANLVLANGIANAPSRATFTVNGEPSLVYDISGGTGNITLTSGANTLIATLTGVWVPSKTLGAGIATQGTIPAGGAGETLGVGASLPLLGTTPSGTYTLADGISLTVAYN